MCANASANSIIKFDGLYKHSAVYFNWEIAPQTQWQSLEVERSLDSSTYLLCLNFNSTNTKIFAWDKEPITGKSFYRLKLTTMNGQIEYSIPITILIKPQNHYYDKANLTNNTYEIAEISNQAETNEYFKKVVDLKGNILFERNAASFAELQSLMKTTNSKGNKIAIELIYLNKVLVSKKIIILNQ